MTAPTVVAIMRETEARQDATGDCLREVLGSTAWRLVCAAELAAVVAEFSPEQLNPTRPNLAKWLEALKQLGLGRAIVPMRFGQAADDQGEIERFLSCRQEHLAGVLDLVGHRVELVVRLTSPVVRTATGGTAGEPKGVAGNVDASAGRRFLLGRKREFFAAAGGDDAETAERIVRLALGKRAIATVHEAPTETIGRGGVCVLVDRACGSEAIGLIRAAAGAEGVSVRITGPLPPLGFSGGHVPIANGAAGAAGADGVDRADSGTRPAHETLPQKAALTRPEAMACER